MTKTIVAVAVALALTGCALPPAVFIAGQIVTPILVDAYCSDANANNRAEIRERVWKDPNLTLVTRDDC